jgi:hypothetical protein
MISRRLRGSRALRKRTRTKMMRAASKKVRRMRKCSPY